MLKQGYRRKRDLWPHQISKTGYEQPDLDRGISLSFSHSVTELVSALSLYH